MTVIPLTELDPGAIDRIGGKAAGLGALIAAGERVPAGFCLTTEAYDAGSIPREEIAAAYADLGDDVPVAVRSSATAEDLPWASFAGQQDTILDVTGLEDLLAAIEACWASLDTERAIAYRAANGVTGSRMAVVVQTMIEPRAAGVLFTANPITGARGEMVIDAAPGLGTAVVDGTVEADHYVLGEQIPQHPRGCLDRAELAELRSVGRRIQEHLGAPQDIEWALDADGTLWLLQSRAVTSLFPVPEVEDGELRVYMEAGHMQGMLRPMTPMGSSVLVQVGRQWLEMFGAGTVDKSSPIRFLGGRMFLELTPFLRNPSTRRRMPEMMAAYGPRVVPALEKVVQDPRLTPQRMRIPLGTVARIVAHTAPSVARGVVAALRRPDAESRRILASADTVREICEGPAHRATVIGHLDLAERVHLAVLGAPMMESLHPLWAAMGCQSGAAWLLKGLATDSEVSGVVRGAPYNVTTEMNLALWRIAAEATDHRELLIGTPVPQLVTKFRDGTLPDIGLEQFLAVYGHRAAAEIDVGVPRWGEDPSPVFDAIANYLRLTDEEQAPDARFRRAAEEAEATIEELVQRARDQRAPIAPLVSFLLRRARQLIGLREFPKYLWLFALKQVRRELLAAGAILVEQGQLDEAEDIMFLDLEEARSAARDGADLRELATQRRATHDREMRRRHVPVVLLSDGTDVEATLPVPEHADGLRGTGAAPGTATGRARVIRDPRGARIDPGEILVAPTTDPGWTPLFLTAAGLVTETGAAMAHGPTVAREYGIPAVICVRDATTQIRTGQLITIDGASGLVTIADEGAEAADRPEGDSSEPRSAVRPGDGA
ncbi:PEP/pyruvate-binding domain-containing protein [Brachybacterium sp. FME24]|uniref:PEP/pyruvate-binding domain-containing protein n=1 Tax=Brachybacterium sp. FME24 TaxID=2742605 RepID=UPI001866ED6E|nr:PEP/pyruvate-binding domain-containing protein [Brachybacterium sp. FME24]